VKFAYSKAVGWDSSRWDRYLHDRRISCPGSPLGAAEDEVASAAWDGLATRVLGGEAAEQRPADRGDSAALHALRAVCDEAATSLGQGIFARLYADSAPVKQGPWWARAAALAVEGAITDELRQTTDCDPDMAALATAQLCSAVAEMIPAILQELEDQGVENPGEDPGVDPGNSDGDGDGDGEGEGVAEGVAEALASAAAVAADAANVAARMTARAVAEAKGALNGLLPGLGTAPRASEQADPRRLGLVEVLRNSKDLAKILRIAGRINRVADRVRRLKSETHAAELSGLEIGAELQRLLPTELADLLLDPEDEDDEARQLLALRRFADRALLQRRSVGSERLGRGPIVVLLDASGSMAATLADGLQRIHWAAAIGIASVRTAVDQRRQIAVATFDGAILDTWRVRKGDLRVAEEAILGLAGISACGGTSFDVAVRWALDNGAVEDRADIVLVTDGFCNMSPQMLVRLGEAKARGLRLWGVIAGEGGFPDAVRGFADGVAMVDGKSDASVQIGEAVQP
jgi:uncharacterized protein with von Willebrand factor type A (vWA) domain